MPIHSYLEEDYMGSHSEYFATRGMSGWPILPKVLGQSRDLPLAYTHCEDMADVLEVHLRSTHSYQKVDWGIVDERMPVPLTFPNFFDRHIDREGNHIHPSSVAVEEREEEDQVNPDVASTPLMSSLSTCGALTPYLHDCGKLLRSLDQSAHYQEYRVTRDELEETHERLLQIADNFEEGL